MSHFTLHVFTPEPPSNIDEYHHILERWDETREVDEYVGNTIPKTEAQRLRDKYYPEKTLDETMDEWENGNAHWSEEKQAYEVFTTYNPESKWDWWQIGGRWDKSLITTNGQGANAARLEDLDFTNRIWLLTREANDLYDQFEEATAGLDIPPTFIEFMEGAEYPKAKLREYEALPWVVAARKVNPDSWTWPHYEYHVGTGGREAYLAENASPDVPRAWVDLDGEWHERGETGWFGAVFNEQPFHEHVAAYRAYRDSLPGSTYVTLLDCHI